MEKKTKPAFVQGQQFKFVMTRWGSKGREGLSDLEQGVDKPLALEVGLRSDSWKHWRWFVPSQMTQMEG